MNCQFQDSCPNLFNILSDKFCVDFFQIDSSAYLFVSEREILFLTESAIRNKIVFPFNIVKVYLANPRTIILFSDCEVIQYDIIENSLKFSNFLYVYNQSEIKDIKMSRSRSQVFMFYSDHIDIHENGICRIIIGRFKYVCQDMNGIIVRDRAVYYSLPSFKRYSFSDLIQKIGLKLSFTKNVKIISHGFTTIFKGKNEEQSNKKTRIFNGKFFQITDEIISDDLGNYGF